MKIQRHSHFSCLCLSPPYSATSFSLQRRQRMFKRSLAVVTVISLITLLPGRLMPASFTTHADRKADKKSSCSTCPINSQDRQAELASKLGTLGQRTQVSPFISLKSSIFEG